MLSLPRLCHAALLSLALLFAQQGAMWHELTQHGIGASRDADDKRTASGERCNLCAAFAHVASAVAIDAAAPALLTGIGFALSAPPTAADRGAEAPTSRSRDPPFGA